MGPAGGGGSGDDDGDGEGGGEWVDGQCRGRETIDRRGEEEENEADDDDVTMLLLLLMMMMVRWRGNAEAPTRAMRQPTPGAATAANREIFRARQAQAPDGDSRAVLKDRRDSGRE